MRALADLDDVAQLVAGEDVLHLLGHRVGVLPHDDDGDLQDLGAGHDDVVGVEVAGEDEAGTVALQRHQLHVRPVAAHDDRGVLVLAEVGHEVVHLHGADEEVLHDLVRLVVGGDDLAAQALGQVRHLDGAHERVLGDDADDLDPHPLEERLEHGLHLVHEGGRDVVQDHAQELVAQGLLHGQQVVVLELVVEAVDDDGLDAQLLDHAHAVHLAVLARVHAARAGHDGHVLAARHLGVGVGDGGHEVRALAGKGLDLEVLGHQDRGEQVGLGFDLEDLLHEMGVLVAELALDLPGNGAHGLHVGHRQVVLLELESQAHDDHVLAREPGGGSHVDTSHVVLLNLPLARLPYARATRFSDG